MMDMTASAPHKMASTHPISNLATILVQVMKKNYSKQYLNSVLLVKNPQSLAASFQYLQWSPSSSFICDEASEGIDELPKEFCYHIHWTSAYNTCKFLSSQTFIKKNSKTFSSATLLASADLPGNCSFVVQSTDLCKLFSRCLSCSLMALYSFLYPVLLSKSMLVTAF